ncbi:hypothetical protein [Nocardiopsis rhodophaea]
MEEVMSSPEKGALHKPRMTDPRLHGDDGWVEMTQNVKGVEINYVHPTKTGQVDAYKIK